MSLAVSPGGGEDQRSTVPAGQIAIGAGRHRVENDRSGPAARHREAGAQRDNDRSARVGKLGARGHTTPLPLPYAVPCTILPAWASLRPYFDALLLRKPQRLGPVVERLVAVAGACDAVRIGVYTPGTASRSAPSAALSTLADEPRQRSRLLT